MAGVGGGIVSTLIALTCVSLVTTSVQDTEGPVCFNCSRTQFPEDCRQSVSCEVSQACSVQEVFGIHGDTYFWSGCEELSLCSEMTEWEFSPASAVGKRQLYRNNGRCLYCCTTDLCNKNCTAFVNLALHKPAYQSSPFDPSGHYGSPELAVDGNTDRNWFHGSCMHTNTELYPWWAVDLQQTYHISRVKIYNRNDTPDRSAHLKILVSNHNATLIPKDSHQFATCGHYVGHSSDGNAITISCPVGTVGRWVRIQDVNPTLEYFHMCEVEVYGF